MRPSKPGPAKLVISLFTAVPALLKETLIRLEEKFGPADFLSEPMPFDHTEYYRDEFGGDLKRRLSSFERPAQQDSATAWPD